MMINVLLPNDSGFVLKTSLAIVPQTDDKAISGQKTETMKVKFLYSRLLYEIGEVNKQLMAMLLNT